MPRRLAQQRMTLSDLANVNALCTSSTLKSISSASRAISAVAELLVFWRWQHRPLAEFCSHLVIQLPTQRLYTPRIALTNNVENENPPLAPVIRIKAVALRTTVLS